VLVAVVVLWIGFRMSRQPDRLSTLASYAAVGTVAVWFSHPSVFVLAGVSTVLVAGALLRRDWRRALALCAASAGWLGSFGVFTLTVGHNLARLQTALSETPGAFHGSGNQGLHSLREGLGEFRYASGIPHFLTYGSVDAGLLLFFLAACFCVIGFLTLVRERPENAGILIAPLGFMLIAWSLHKYPLLGRTQLFLVPSFILLLAEGVVYAVRRPTGTSARVASVACAAAIGVALAAPAIGHTAQPQRIGDLKPVLRYLAHEQRPGDTLFVYYTAEAQFRYYLECGCGGTDLEIARRSGLWRARPGAGGPQLFAPALQSISPRLVIAPYLGEDPASYVPSLDAVRGRRRVWVLVSHLDENELKKFLLNPLDQRGAQHASFSIGKGRDSAAVFLYDLTRPPR
jgi:hypothetical protein